MIKSLFVPSLLLFSTLASAGDKQPDCNLSTPIECEMFSAINKERSQEGMKALTVLERCVKAADEHAVDMAEHNYFAHDGRTESWHDRMTRFKLSPGFVAENIAYSSRIPKSAVDEQANVASTVRSWMTSPGHRQNILNPSFASTGISYERGYWVQCFSGF